MIFLETSAFTRRIASLLSDDEYAELQCDLVERPDLGDVIPQSGGIRKLPSPPKGMVKAAALV